MSLILKNASTAQYERMSFIIMEITMSILKNNCTPFLCSVMYWLDGIHVVGHAWSWISYKMLVLVRYLIFFFSRATVQIFDLFIELSTAQREEGNGNITGGCKRGPYPSRGALDVRIIPNCRGSRPYVGDLLCCLKQI